MLPNLLVLMILPFKDTEPPPDDALTFLTVICLVKTLNSAPMVLSPAFSPLTNSSGILIKWLVPKA